MCGWGDPFQGFSMVSDVYNNFVRIIKNKGREIKAEVYPEACVSCLDLGRSPIRSDPVVFLLSHQVDWFTLYITL